MIITDGIPYIGQIKALIAEYAERLGRDLSFQDIDDELSDPAHKYSPPNGELLTEVENGKVLGMVAYKRHTAQRCEMKRLYVTPESRGMALGEKLIAAITEHARAAGYSEMVLDTIAPLKAAIHLYKKAGFEECPAYYDNPMADVIYFRKDLN